MLFKYHAFANDGQRITGHMWACGESIVRTQLRTLQIQPIRIDRVLRITHQLKYAELIDFLLYLTWMLRAGIPVREAIEELTRSAHSGEQCKIAVQMMHYMDSGLLLSETMALLPAVFNPLAVYYTVVGEKSGDLVQQLTQLVAALKWQASWREKMIRVLAYPVFTLCVAVAALLYLLLDVVPVLAALLPTDETPLRVALAFSRWLHSYGVMMVGLGLAIGVGGWVCLQRSLLFRYRWDRCVLRLPMVGRIVRDLELTRMADVIAHLHTAGFTLFDCLVVAQDLVLNQAIQAQIAWVVTALEQGATLTESFMQAGVFPSMLLRALHLAEKSGHVAVALTHAAQFFRNQMTTRMRLLETLLAPGCLLVIGGVLMGLVLFVFVPLFDVIGQV